MGEVFHLWNRGVDGRKIFLDQRDHERFILALKAFNSFEPARLDRIEDIPEIDPSEKLVSIVAYTLLDNHFHICLREERVGGMTTFLRKIGTGYTHFFDLRHRRRGRLFESKMQLKRIKTDTQLQHLIAYIHLNVLDRTDKTWREGKMLQWKEKENLLIQYLFSSAKAYLTGGPDPLVDWNAVKELISPNLGNLAREHKKYLAGWSVRHLVEVELRQKVEKKESK